MGRELVERDDGAWWIVETVTEPKMRISRVFTNKAEALTARGRLVSVELVAQSDTLHERRTDLFELGSER